MTNPAGRSRLGKHAVYPGSFDPITPGHLDIIERTRHLFSRVTVLVAVNADKQSASGISERAVLVRGKLPADWDNVSVVAWAGLTAAFCRQHGAHVVIPGVRSGSDFCHEYAHGDERGPGHHHAAPARAAGVGGRVVDDSSRAQHLTPPAHARGVDCAEPPFP